MRTTKLDTRWTVLTLLLAGCDVVPIDAAPAGRSPHLVSPQLSRETPPMLPATNATTPDRPPLDLRAPKHLETATFALG